MFGSSAGNLRADGLEQGLPFALHELALLHLAQAPQVVARVDHDRGHLVHHPLEWRHEQREEVAREEEISGPATRPDVGE